MLENKGNGVWGVTPVSDYEFDTTYMAKLSGNIEFADYVGEELTFTTKRDENHVNEHEYRDGVVFLQKLENTSAGYYPYEVTVPANSEYMYLTVGKADGLEVGQIICIGDVTSVEEITSDTECDFGKIDSIYPLETGEWMVILSAPELEEIFTKLDISFSEIVDLESAQIDTEEVESEIVSALYASEDFVKFLSSVNVATRAYLADRNMDMTPVINTASFMDKVKLEPTMKFEDNKLIVK